MITGFIVGYIVFIIGFSAFSIVGIYHLNRYGYAGDMSRPVVIGYSILALLIIGSTLGFIVTH